MMTTIDIGEQPRILLVRLSAIGDVVVTTPVIRALREGYPKAHLAWLVEEKAADVVRGNPDLDEVIIWRRATWRAKTQGAWGTMRRARLAADFVRDLRSRRYDVVIDFQGLLRSGCLAWASGARFRIGSEAAREGSRWFHNVRIPRTEDTSSRQRCLDLLRPLGIHSSRRQMWVWFDRADEVAARALLEKQGIGPEASLVCLCPATTWRHKHWREEGWAALADRLATECDVIPLFMGAAGDRPLVARIQERMRTKVPVVAGETTLKQAAALLSMAKLVVAVDTGLMHVGVAVGTPVIGVCGPSYWPGFQDYENFRLIRRPFPCSPCIRHPICRADDCMTAITADEVFVEARLLLSSAAFFLPVV